jgi:glycosyltransferase involved in cell wall biosynthesis
MLMPKLLFILKEGTSYGDAPYGGSMRNNGLYNSAKLVVDMLNKEGVESTLIQVVDSDSVDAAIKKYQPTNVVLEALWVEPKNLQKLQDLNPTVNFLVRIHSETAFLVQEIIAIDWIKQYINQGVTVGFNSLRTAEIMSDLYPGELVVFSPDYFKITRRSRVPNVGEVLNIGCFGALRQMKNQLNQAIAAIEYGRQVGKPVNFHINTSFHGDTTGAAILSNLRALFAGSSNTLVEHPWLSEADFAAILGKMDVAMQVSLSESFNLVAAEATDLRVPIVVSREIIWAHDNLKAAPADVDDIVDKLTTAIADPRLVEESIEGIRKYSDISKKVWRNFIQTVNSSV